MKKISLNGIAIKKESVADIVRGTLVAIIFAIVLVLLLALTVKFTGWDATIVMPINQVIKIICILIGCFLGIKTIEQGALKGGLLGLLFTLISLFLFATIQNSKIFSLATLVDILAGIVIGTVSGILTVNVKH